MKTCFKCGEEKQLDDFYVHKMMADGHLNKCKECCKKYEFRRREETEASRLSDVKRYKNNPERKQQIKNQTILWRKKYPEKYKAHNFLNNSIRDGKLKRMPCIICGNQKSHAHHHDYSKPLEVTWLCVKCHALEHKKINREII